MFLHLLNTKPGGLKAQETRPANGGPEGNWIGSNVKNFNGGYGTVARQGTVNKVTQSATQILPGFDLSVKIIIQHHPLAGKGRAGLRPAFPAMPKWAMYSCR